MIGSQAMFEQQVKLNLLMICFVITEEPILTNTKNIIQTMKTPYFLPKRKTFDEQLTEEKKNSFYGHIRIFFLRWEPGHSICPLLLPTTTVKPLTKKLHFPRLA